MYRLSLHLSFKLLLPMTTHSKHGGCGGSDFVTTFSGRQNAPWPIAFTACMRTLHIITSSLHEIHFCCRNSTNTVLFTGSSSMAKFSPRWQWESLKVQLWLCSHLPISCFTLFTVWGLACQNHSVWPDQHTICIGAWNVYWYLTSMQKTSQITTQRKGDSHTFKTAKITVFDPMMCKSPDVPSEAICHNSRVWQRDGRMDGQMLMARLWLHSCS